MKKIDISHIAHLARIKLNEGEKDKLSQELTSIVSFIEKLNEVDTENVAAMRGGTEDKNIMREDKQADNSLEGDGSELVEAAPRKNKDYIVVSSVFE